MKNKQGFIRFLPLIIAGIILLGGIATVSLIYRPQQSATQNNLQNVGAATLLYPQQGGTGIGSYTAGDMLFASGTYTLSKLASSSAYSVLNINPTTGRPAWTQTLGSPASPLTAIYGTSLYASSTYISRFVAAPMIMATSTWTAPDAYYSGDTNTGFGQGGEDNFRLYTGGTARLTIDNNGNVGIGTTAPATPLHVSGDGQLLRLTATGTNAGVWTVYNNSTLKGTIGWATGGYYLSGAIDDSLRLNGNNGLALGAGGVTGININTAGNVGIGTTTPGSALDISGDNQGLLRLRNSVNPYIGFYRGSTRVGYDGFGGGDNYHVANEISGGDIYLSTTGAGDVLINNGNVGIGTTGPGGTAASGMAAGAKVLEIRSPSVSTDAGLFVRRSDAAVGLNIWQQGASPFNTYIDSSWQDDTSHLIFRVKTDGVTPVNAMTILGSGNVGIGTTSPWSLFSVAGTITQTAVKSCSLGIQADSNGALTACVASSEKLKTNILPAEYPALKIIGQLQPKNYEWKDKIARDNLTHTGFIAEDVERVFPLAVVGGGIDKDGTVLKAVDPNAINALLVRGMQELNAKIDAKNGIDISEIQKMVDASVDKKLKEMGLIEKLKLLFR